MLTTNNVAQIPVNAILPKSHEKNEKKILLRRWFYYYPKNRTYPLVWHLETITHHFENWKRKLGDETYLPHICAGYISSGCEPSHEKKNLLGISTFVTSFTAIRENGKSVSPFKHLDTDYPTDQPNNHPVTSKYMYLTLNFICRDITLLRKQII